MFGGEDSQRWRHSLTYGTRRGGCKWRLSSTLRETFNVSDQHTPLRVHTFIRMQCIARVATCAMRLLTCECE